jgi:aminopeptidase N
LAPKLESVLWSGYAKSKSANIKKLYFEGYSDIFLSKEALAKLQSIWQLRKAPSGIHLYEDDYTALALQLALRVQDNTANQRLLDTALIRITNPDKKASFKIVMQAVSSDPDKRDQFFNGIGDPDGRKNERAVLSGLYLLSHPLRQPGSEKYIKPGLRLLEDIQATGTIFFPKGFMSALLYYYNSPGVLATLNDYLQAHKTDQPRMTEKLLQASDLLRRSNAWVYPLTSEGR